MHEQHPKCPPVQQVEFVTSARNGTLVDSFRVVVSTVFEHVSRIREAEIPHVPQRPEPLRLRRHELTDMSI